MAKEKRLKNIPQEILSLPFFYSDFQNSNEASECIKRFNPEGSGCYLLRLSSKGDNYLSLSVSINNQAVRHVNIIMEKSRTGLQYYIVPEIKFRTIRDLCHFYKEHRIGNLEKIDNVRLLFPINKQTVDSHTYDTLGSACSTDVRNSSGSGRHIPLIPHTLPQSRLNPLSPKSPEGKSPMGRRSGSSSLSIQDIRESRMSLDSQGNENRTSSSSFDEPVAASRHFFPQNIFHKNPTLSESSVGQNKAMKMNNDKSSRPPLPLPLSPGMSEVYYSSPKDEKIDRTENLRQMLKSSEVCDCGIRISESELPHGWTIHRSNEINSKDRLFYQNTKGDTTWVFPPQLLLDLTETQRQNIIRLSQQGGKEPPKILYNPDYNEVMSKLLAEKKRSEMAGLVYQPHPETVKPSSAHTQFDLVIPLSQQQQFKPAGRTNDPSNTQMEFIPEVENDEPSSEQQYLSGTRLKHDSTSSQVNYISQSQNPTQFNPGLQSQHGQILNRTRPDNQQTFSEHI